MAEITKQGAGASAEFPGLLLVTFTSDAVTQAIDLGFLPSRVRAIDISNNSHTEWTRGMGDNHIVTDFDTPTAPTAVASALVTDVTTGYTGISLAVTSGADYVVEIYR